jgi:hypothetical protein
VPLLMGQFFVIRSYLPGLALNRLPVLTSVLLQCDREQSRRGSGRGHRRSSRLPRKPYLDTLRE